MTEAPASCRQCGKPINRGRLCKDCRKLYDKNYFKQNASEKSASASQRKRAILDWYRKSKSGKACNICGGTFPVVCMDYDHMPGHRKFMEVSKMVRLGYEKEKIEAEIAKCQLLCANCHRILTVERRQNG
jgi:hypothetical protein